MADSRLNVRMSAEFKQRLKLAAVHERMTMTELVLSILSDWLDKFEKQQKK